MIENSIIFLENEHTIVYDGKNPVLDTKNKHPELFSAIVIPLKYIHFFSYKIPNTTSDDELTQKTELKMYKEGGLDVEKEYTIDFIKYDFGEEYLVEAFALAKDDFDLYLAEFAYEIDVVDLAFPRFLAYEALYDTNNAEKTNDLYLYISDDEAFGAIYQDGKYIGNRIINSLQSISKRTGLELVKLKEYLKEKGFKRENYSLEETMILDMITEVFSKDIEKIVYSVNHKRGLFGLSGIDSLFIDFDGHSLEGIEDFFSQYGLEPTVKPLQQAQESQYPAHSVLLNYLFKLHNNADYAQVNLTHLARKKPLVEYVGFQYLVEVFITSILLLSIGVVGDYYLDAQKETISQLDSKVKKQKKRVKELSLQMKKIKKKNNSLLQEKKALQDKIFVYETTFRIIPMSSHISAKRQKMMNDIVKVLKTYRLNSESMLQKDEKNFEILLISQSNRRSDISKFMHDLIDMGYKDVTTQDIKYENGIYKSKIYIGLEKID